MLIPVGLDESRLNRRPWISIAILAACVVAFALTALSGWERTARSRAEELAAYWMEHPYLQLTSEAEQLVRSRLASLGDRVALRAATTSPPAPAFLALEQQHFDVLCAALVEAYESLPVLRFSLVPARGLSQVGWVTHLFMHGGLAHLVGNMIVFFLVVGPFLEDVWGRPFFLAFFLAGGLFAGACQALPMGNSPVPILGASGAISACLGAFALRFAHRRVRILYWLLLFLRGSFFVPVWLYALFGAALDIVGLRISGTAGGVAYAAHVGGFLFGVVAALIVRATHLEDRIAPEGAVPWQGSLGAARAADALAAGRLSEARFRFEEVLAKHPQDEEALLGLARLGAAAGDRRAVTECVDRLLVQRLGSTDAEALSAVLAEFGAWTEPALLRPSTAYRVGEALERSSAADAARFLEAVAETRGAIGAKASLRAAVLLREKDPVRAIELAERVLASDDVPAELASRARELVDRWRPQTPAKVAGDAPTALPLGAGALVRVFECQLVGLTPAGLELVAAGPRKASVALDRIEALAVGLLAAFSGGREPRQNTVVVDFMLRNRPGEARTVLRVLGHSMALHVIRPGIPSRHAFAELIGMVLAGSSARAVPNPLAAAGQPFARFADTATFEEACYGRPISAAAGRPLARA